MFYIDKTEAMLPRVYTREALKRGLAYEATLGANPAKFGLVGSTDAHPGLSTAEEANSFAKVAILEPTEPDPQKRSLGSRRRLGTQCAIPTAPTLIACR